MQKELRREVEPCRSSLPAISPRGVESGSKLLNFTQQVAKLSLLASVVIAGRRSSVSVEDDFWASLRDIAKKQHQTLSDLVGSIKAEGKQTNLSSAIRLFVLDFYRDQFEASVAQTQQLPHIKIIAKPL